MKDRTWKDRPNAPDFEDVGPGAIDFPDIFAAGQGRRLDKHYFVEHDIPKDPYQSLKASYNYLTNLDF